MQALHKPDGPVPLYQTDPDVSPLLLIKVIVPLDGSVEMLDGSLETI